LVLIALKLRLLKEAHRTCYDIVDLAKQQDDS